MKSTIQLIRLLAAVPGALLSVAPAHAQYIVTSTGDGGDANWQDFICADVQGVCTLRAAIEQANWTPALDLIHFDIAPSSVNDCDATGVCTFRPATPLPQIKWPVVLDGYTQPLAKANTLATVSPAPVTS